MIPENLIYMILAVGFSVFLMVMFALTLGYLRKIKYEYEYRKYMDLKEIKNNASFKQYDESRDYFEKRIYDLQEKLLNNEKRWNKINHLILDAQSNVIDKSIKENDFIDLPFFSKLGIDYQGIILDPKFVFVLTPYIREEEQTYKIIKNVCMDVGLKCSRGDEVFRDNNILSHIVSEILKSKIVIVNINGRNPNVFYELGICHTIGKKVILISENKDNIPFDIINKNIVFYKDDEELASRLKNELLKIFIDIREEE